MISGQQNKVKSFSSAALWFNSASLLLAIAFVTTPTIANYVTFEVSDFILYKDFHERVYICPVMTDNGQPLCRKYSSDRHSPECRIVLLTMKEDEKNPNGTKSVSRVQMYTDKDSILLRLLSDGVYNFYCRDTKQPDPVVVTSQRLVLLTRQLFLDCSSQPSMVIVRARDDDFTISTNHSDDGSRFLVRVCCLRPLITTDMLRLISEPFQLCHSLQCTAVLIGPGPTKSTTLPIYNGLLALPLNIWLPELEEWLYRRRSGQRSPQKVRVQCDMSDYTDSLVLIESSSGQVESDGSPFIEAFIRPDSELLLSGNDSHVSVELSISEGPEKGYRLDHSPLMAAMKCSIQSMTSQVKHLFHIRFPLANLSSGAYNITCQHKSMPDISVGAVKNYITDAYAKWDCSRAPKVIYLPAGEKEKRVAYCQWRLFNVSVNQSHLVDSVANQGRRPIKCKSESDLVTFDPDGQLTFKVDSNHASAGIYAVKCPNYGIRHFVVTTDPADFDLVLFPPEYKVLSKRFGRLWVRINWKIRQAWLYHGRMRLLFPVKCNITQQASTNSPDNDNSSKLLSFTNSIPFTKLPLGWIDLECHVNDLELVTTLTIQVVDSLEELLELGPFGEQEQETTTSISPTQLKMETTTKTTELGSESPNSTTIAPLTTSIITTTTSSVNESIENQTTFSTNDNATKTTELDSEAFNSTTPAPLTTLGINTTTSSFNGSAENKTTTSKISGSSNQQTQPDDLNLLDSLCPKPPISLELILGPLVQMNVGLLPNTTLNLTELGKTCRNESNFTLFFHHEDLELILSPRQTFYLVTDLPYLDIHPGLISQEVGERERYWASQIALKCHLVQTPVDSKDGGPVLLDLTTQLDDLDLLSNTYVIQCKTPIPLLVLEHPIYIVRASDLELQIKGLNRKFHFHGDAYTYTCLVMTRLSQLVPLKLTEQTYWFSDHSNPNRNRASPRGNKLILSANVSTGLHEHWCLFNQNGIELKIKLVFYVIGTDRPVDMQLTYVGQKSLVYTDDDLLPFIHCSVPQLNSEHSIVPRWHQLNGNLRFRTWKQNNFMQETVALGLDWIEHSSGVMRCSIKINRQCMSRLAIVFLLGKPAELRIDPLQRRMTVQSQLACKTSLIESFTRFDIDLSLVSRHFVLHRQSRHFHGALSSNASNQTRESVDAKASYIRRLLHLDKGKQVGRIEAIDFGANVKSPNWSPGVAVCRMNEIIMGRIYRSYKVVNYMEILAPINVTMWPSDSIADPDDQVGCQVTSPYNDSQVYMMLTVVNSDEHNSKSDYNVINKQFLYGPDHSKALLIRDGLVKLENLTGGTYLAECIIHVPNRLPVSNAFVFELHVPSTGLEFIANWSGTRLVGWKCVPDGYPKTAVEVTITLSPRVHDLFEIDKNSISITKYTPHGNFSAECLFTQNYKGVDQTMNLSTELSYSDDTFTNDALAYALKTNSWIAPLIVQGLCTVFLLIVSVSLAYFLINTNSDFKDDDINQKADIWPIYVKSNKFGINRRDPEYFRNLISLYSDIQRQIIRVRRNSWQQTSFDASGGSGGWWPSGQRSSRGSKSVVTSEAISSMDHVWSSDDEQDGSEILDRPSFRLSSSQPGRRRATARRSTYLLDPHTRQSLARLKQTDEKLASKRLKALMQSALADDSEGLRKRSTHGRRHRRSTLGVK